MWSVVAFFLFVFSSKCLCEDGKFNLSLVRLEEISAVSETTGSRIIGGQATSIENYPFTVQVLYNNQLSCGGSLVTSRHVLSAAHCFVDLNGVTASARLFKVRAGTSASNSGGTLRDVSRIVPHAYYNSPVRDNDIAVLVLDRRYSLGARIAIASIPAQGGVVPENATVIHVGWGRTSVTIPVLATTLQEVSVRKVNRDVCSARYRYLEELTREPFPVTTNMICAGLLDVGGADACQGDSGGPLIYAGVVVGVTSWGYRCAEPFFPGVSARVSNYTTWINHTVTTNGVRGGSEIFSIPLLLSIMLLHEIGWK